MEKIIVEHLFFRQGILILYHDIDMELVKKIERLPHSGQRRLRFRRFFLAGAEMKIWNARKRFICYSSIDRS
jgi:hypothetical protein